MIFKTGGSSARASNLETLVGIYNPRAPKISGVMRDLKELLRIEFKAKVIKLQMGNLSFGKKLAIALVVVLVPYFGFIVYFALDGFRYLDSRPVWVRYGLAAYFVGSISWLAIWLSIAANRHLRSILSGAKQAKSDKPGPAGKRSSRLFVMFAISLACVAVNMWLALMGHYRLPLLVFVLCVGGGSLVVRKLPST